MRYDLLEEDEVDNPNSFDVNIQSKERKKEREKKKERKRETAAAAG
jgi:hypothetical protein